MCMCIAFVPSPALSACQSTNETVLTKLVATFTLKGIRNFAVTISVKGLNGWSILMVDPVCLLPNRRFKGELFIICACQTPKIALFPIRHPVHFYVTKLCLWKESARTVKKFKNHKVSR